ncbi:Putative metal-sulfur cluster biosynthesis proteins YuaD [Neobacillus rhizosphaerae]|uniref:Metal-sulfur cluster biosynthesis proteins YuaD n=1 Tax=Neobacillus rhizosphaerae TaxID=2880965 RepID=A0ABN8KR15_9BACI|nr:MOSC domain-containing protein [Neobacillus rhizosphaerae]CAH2714964.1 Putative metal-sulfur cluster biosynthesis proteins YuaD [Neobacillus rhizosphaerae]
MEKVPAKVRAILLADDPETFVTRRISEVNLEFGGMRGDRHFGVTSKADSRQPMYPRGTEILNRRQITIVSEEELARIADELEVESVMPEWLGANLLVKGFPDLTKLTMGSRILFPSGAGLICMGENQPCTLPGDVLQKHYEDHEKLAFRFVRAGYKRRGIVCAVERPGIIHEGDEVQILVNDFTNPMQ